MNDFFPLTSPDPQVPDVFISMGRVDLLSEE
ncbi:hypothetical protein SAMN05518668_11918 [Sphingobium sp. YR657]|jgi:hypothetical protein|nr:hypothetical protein SAMN05518668_11918 [Sphingobium sp. YR657]